MIKMNLFLKRRANLSPEQFSSYWENIHWPKIKNDTDATALALRYVQQHRVDGVPPGLREAPFDGIVEGWWPDLQTMYSVLGSPQWAAIIQDEGEFVAQTKTLTLNPGASLEISCRPHTFKKDIRETHRRQILSTYITNR